MGPDRARHAAPQTARAQAAAETARLMSIPGIGPVGAMAFQAFAPPPEGFRRGRDFAAWLGPVPRQHGTGARRGAAGCRRWTGATCAPPVRQRSHDGDPPRRAARLRQGPLAHAHVGAQARDARRRRARQPHGADGVGGGEEGVGPRSESGRPTRRPRPGWRRRRGQTGGTGKGERSSRRGRENRFSSSRPRARGNDSDPTRVPPDRPAAHDMPQPEAGHMTALDRTAQTRPKKLLAPTGASTHGGKSSCA